MIRSLSWCSGMIRRASVSASPAIRCSVAPGPLITVLLDALFNIISPMFLFNQNELVFNKIYHFILFCDDIKYIFNSVKINKFVFNKKYFYHIPFFQTFQCSCFNYLARPSFACFCGAPRLSCSICL